MNFNQLTKDILGPIFGQHGYTLFNEQKNQLEYIQENIQINISYDEQVSYEVLLTFNFLPRKDNYSLREILHILHPSVSNSPEKAVQIQEEVKLINWLKEVQLYLQDLLPAIIANHSHIRGLLDAKRAKDIEQEKIRKLEYMIHQYWKEKNYEGIISLMAKNDLPVGESIKFKHVYALKTAQTVAKHRFNEALHTAVLTTRFIYKERKPILTIFHHLVDGMWEFIGADECKSDDDYLLVSLEEMIQLDASVQEVSGLPPGQAAFRSAVGQPWAFRQLK